MVIRLCKVHGNESPTLSVLLVLSVLGIILEKASLGSGTSPAAAAGLENPQQRQSVRIRAGCVKEKYKEAKRKIGAIGAGERWSSAVSCRWECFAVGEKRSK